MFRVNYFWWLALAIALVEASSGDRAPEFKDCVAACLETTLSCKLSLALRLTRWTCLDDCRYQCMHAITAKAIAGGTQVHQYFGKWPFIRLAGIQEPASFLFSMFNLVAHVRGAFLVDLKIPKGHPMKTYYYLWAWVSTNAWVWSCVFHARDLPTTEKLDYFCAASAILFALYFTVIRTFHIYPKFDDYPVHAKAPSSTSLYLKLWTFTCLATYAAHVCYLTIPSGFDYSYNMAFNVIIGLSHNFLWLTYSFPSAYSPFRRFPFRLKTYRPRFANKVAVFVILTTAATGLELFDFSPLGGTIDAHALWHLSTVPITKFWYEFLVEDALDDGWWAQKG